MTFQNIKERIKNKNLSFKIMLTISLALFLTGTGLAVNHIFFREIKIEISEIKWVEEVKMEITELQATDLIDPCFLVIKRDNSKMTEKGKLVVQKKRFNMGVCTNSNILVPLEIKSQLHNNNANIFFIPQFTAKIVTNPGELKENQKLKANFSLFLKQSKGSCKKDQEEIKGKGFSLCDVGIHSSNVGSFSITDGRKNTLAGKIRTIGRQNNYVLILKIRPDPIIMRELNSFSIILENIVPTVVFE